MPWDCWKCEACCVRLTCLMCLSACYSKLADSTPTQLRPFSQPECRPFLSLFSFLFHPVSIFISSLSLPLPLSSPLYFSTTQEAIITGLLPETTYSVTVAAYTTKGDGARSKAKVVTTTGAGVCCAITHSCMLHQQILK